MKEKLIAFLQYLLNTISNSTISNMTGTVNRVLRFNDQDGQVVTLIIDYLSPFAFALIVIYFLVGLAEQYSHVGREITMDSFIKALSGVVIADVMLNAAYKLVEVFMNLTNRIGPDLMEAYYNSGTANVGNALTDVKFNINLLGLIVVFVALILGFGVSILSTLIITFMCMSTKLEIMVRYAFAPLGLANFANSNDKSSAMRYLRKMLASSFYGAALCVVMIAAIHLGADANTLAADAGMNMEAMVDFTDEELEKIETEAEENAQKQIDMYYSNLTNEEDDEKKDKAYEMVKENLEETARENAKNAATLKLMFSKNAFAGAFIILYQAFFQLLAPVAAIGAVSAAKSIVNEAFGA